MHDRLRAWRLEVAILAIVLVALVAYIFLMGAERRRFYRARDAQWAAIQRIGDYPPRGWTGLEWRNALVTLHNVWGNTLSEPDSATPAEMAYLQARLDEIVAETTTENSIESVDRVFSLLLDRKNVGDRYDFIENYRQEFREAFLTE